MGFDLGVGDAGLEVEDGIAGDEVSRSLIGDRSIEGSIYASSWKALRIRSISASCIVSCEVNDRIVKLGVLC